MKLIQLWKNVKGIWKSCEIFVLTLISPFCAQLFHIYFTCLSKPRFPAFAYPAHANANGLSRFVCACVLDLCPDHEEATYHLNIMNLL